MAAKGQLTAGNVPSHMGRYDVAGVLAKRSSPVRSMVLIGTARSSSAAPTPMEPFQPAGAAAAAAATDNTDASSPFAGFHKPVAIKRIAPTLAYSNLVSVRPFLERARVVTGIRHTNVVQIREVGHVDGEVFLVMDYLQGETAATLLRRLGVRGERLDFMLATHIIAEACAGLEAAHDLDILHEQLTPRDLFIGYDGRVRVLDIGIAAARTRLAGEAGGVGFELPYASPERCNRKRLDRCSEVFSLGTMLWELHTGFSPFERDKEDDTIRAICESPSADTVLPGAPKEISQIAMQALSRDKTKRYPTALALRHALLDALRRLGPGSDTAEDLRKLMKRLFEMRIRDKAEMLKRIERRASIAGLDVGEADEPVETGGGTAATTSEPEPAAEKPAPPAEKAAAPLPEATKSEPKPPPKPAPQSSPKTTAQPILLAVEPKIAASKVTPSKAPPLPEKNAPSSSRSPAAAAPAPAPAPAPPSSSPSPAQPPSPPVEINTLPRPAVEVDSSPLELAVLPKPAVEVESSPALIAAVAVAAPPASVPPPPDFLPRADDVLAAMSSPEEANAVSAGVSPKDHDGGVYEAEAEAEAEPVHAKQDASAASAASDRFSGIEAPPPRGALVIWAVIALVVIAGSVVAVVMRREMNDTTATVASAHPSSSFPVALATTPPSSKAPDDPITPPPRASVPPPTPSPAIVATTAPSASATASASASVAETSTLHIETVPAHATIFIAGAKNGVSPLELKLPKSREVVMLEIRHAGYHTLRERVTPNTNQRLKLTMVARPASSGSSGPFHKFE